MKAYLLFYFLVRNLVALGQSQNEQTNCPLLTNDSIKVFIPGSRDTVWPNGERSFVIPIRLLTGGFELISNDSSARIQSYTLVFNDSQGNIYKTSTLSSKMTNDKNSVITLDKITEASIVAITNVYVRYKGMCYRVKAQFYSPQKQ